MREDFSTGKDLDYLVAQAAKGLNINLDRAERLIEEWKHLYPKIEEWHKKLEDAAMKMRERHQLYPSHGDSVEELSVAAENNPKIVGYQVGGDPFCLVCIDKMPKGIPFSIKKGDSDFADKPVLTCRKCSHRINTLDENLPSSCECDNTHKSADTVCRWCHAYGRRKWDDPKICNCCLEKLENLKPVTTCGEQEYWCDGCMEQEGVIIEQAPTPGDECPDCKHGTVERIGNEIRCQGECGMIWEIKVANLDNDKIECDNCVKVVLKKDAHRIDIYNYLCTECFEGQQPEKLTLCPVHADRLGSDECTYLFAGCEVNKARAIVDQISTDHGSTMTGRWPADRPNLQNVNPKTEMGSRIKEAFTPKGISKHDLESVLKHSFQINWEPESEWDEHPNWSVQDWLISINADNTRQGYHSWVRSKIEEMLKAEKEDEKEEDEG